MTTSARIVIQPTTGWRAIDLREMWAYRDLLAIFAWRDLKVRYRQTLLGALWVMGQPLVTMLIFAPRSRARGGVVEERVYDDRPATY